MTMQKIDEVVLNAWANLGKALEILRAFESDKIEERERRAYARKAILYLEPCRDKLNEVHNELISN